MVSVAVMLACLTYITAEAVYLVAGVAVIVAGVVTGIDGGVAIRVPAFVIGGVTAVIVTVIEASGGAKCCRDRGWFCWDCVWSSSNSGWRG